MAVLKDVPAASWKVELAFLARSRMEFILQRSLFLLDVIYAHGNRKEENASL
jgi:hypothetical protein